MQVRLNKIIYHIKCVSQGIRNVQGAAWIIGDLPFGAYQESKEQAYASACAVLKAGAHMIKLEGGEQWAIETIRFLSDRGVPVCAHLGLTPQTVHYLGGYKLQGTGENADRLKKQAKAVEQAGALMLVLEMIPASLATEITKDLTLCPTIGIGAGNGTSGQVLVLHDMLGLAVHKTPKFVKNFLEGKGDIQEAIRSYIIEVKSGVFPNNSVHAW